MDSFRLPVRAEVLTLSTDASHSIYRASDVAISLLLVKVTKRADWHAFASCYNATNVEVCDGKIR